MRNLGRIVFMVTMASILALAGSSAFAAANKPCTVYNNNGNITITPSNCQYDGPEDLNHGTDNLSWDPKHRFFTNVSIAPGGTLGGTVDTFDSTLDIKLTGNGPLEGYQGSVSVPANCEAHAGPWSMDDSPISFDTEMMRIEGQLEEGSNSDFSYLRIVGGTDFGFPSPGHTTASTQDGELYVVDSMFEIGYRIEYVGAEGGPLEGYAGELEGTAVMKAYANSEDPDSGEGR